MGQALAGRAAGDGPAGALVALVDLGSIQGVLNSVDTGRNGFVSLFLRDGWMLATSPRVESLFAKNWFNTPMFQQHLPKAAVGTVQQVMARDGTERVYSYRALPDLPVVVSTGISLTDALADWRTRIGWDAMLLLAVCSALGLAARSMSRTTARREDGERRATDDARQAKLAITSARDEAQRSERFLRAITDKLPIRIAYVDRAMRYVFVNRAQSEHLGLPREAILGKSRQEIGVLPLSAIQMEAVAAVHQGQETRFEFEDGPAGARQVMEGYLVPDTGPAGEVQGFYLAATDVTGRHAQQARIEQALAERETLLREVYHRVKNNLQVIQSLLNLQRRSLPVGAARGALDDSIQRVQSMALVHEKLYQTGNLQAIHLPEYTADLLRHLGEAADAGPRRIRLSARIDPIDAPLEAAVPFGLLVTELVINSLKHGFPPGLVDPHGDRSSGHIEVQLQRCAGGAQLVVQDNGCGLPAGYALGQPGASMGLQLAISLAQQLGGELRLEPHAGARFTALVTRLGGAPAPDRQHPAAALTPA